ncbi:hypothetical protein PRZ48_010875 [Zasmidium cellare]|uniref:Uncharacterized protein n=1 Tax=Zasmidium cellare TaxID=395010 RepID=A0ABR0EA88_ZASCE|nr:hypothetical protein PRZ48_010875 [Zasmidium cellare]
MAPREVFAGTAAVTDGDTAATPKESASTPNAATPNTPLSAESGKHAQDYDGISGTSSSKRMKIADRAATSSIVPITPGNLKDPKSFCVVSHGEAACAAYLGYSDAADLRRFICSGDFLKHFHRYAQEWASGVRASKVLEEIKNCFLDPDSDDYPLDAEEVSKTFSKFYPHPMDPSEADAKKKNATLQEYRFRQKKSLAYILILMVDQIGEGGTECPYDTSTRDTYIEKLPEKLQHIKEMPDFSKERVRFPQLKTSFDGESELEPYNRALNLLRYAYFMFSTNVWPTRIAVMKPDLKMDFGDKYTPHWMRPKLSTDVTSVPETVIEAPEQEALSKLDFRLVLRTRWTEDEVENDEKEEFEALKDEIEIPDSMPSSGDPRVHTKYQFRDTIRMDYKCIERGIRLCSVVIAIPVNGHMRDREVARSEWETVQADLNKCSEGTHIDVFIKLKKHDEFYGNNELESDVPPPPVRYKKANEDVEQKDVFSLEDDGNSVPTDADS